MTLQAGTIVKALPTGWDDKQYDGTKKEVEGTLEIIETKADPLFNLPAFKVYLIGTTPVDPITIEQVLATLTAANPCHDPDDGRFCEKETKVVDVHKAISSLPPNHPANSVLDSINTAHWGSVNNSRGPNKNCSFWLAP